MPEWASRELIHGAGELDLVRSGLDDTMCLAYQQIREARERNHKVLITGRPPMSSRLRR